VRGLRSLEREVEAGLGLRVSDDGPPVEVYILKDRESFTHFLTFYFPELPPRRAFFLAQGPKRVVYTFHNDRLDEDLRHEATHALMHAAVGDLPLWLDEGLAEYFERPEGHDGVNPEHVGRLPADLQAGWQPDLARLESLTSVREMTPRDYRESWAWVHYALNASPETKAALLGYLADLRVSPKSAAPLSDRLARLDAHPEQGLLSHIRQVGSTPAVASPSPASDPTILLQNAPLDPAPAASRPATRRSLIGRFLGLLGGGRNASEGR
jgi:hypothetical protein